MLNSRPVYGIIDRPQNCLFKYEYVYPLGRENDKYSATVFRSLGSRTLQNYTLYVCCGGVGSGGGGGGGVMVQKPSKRFTNV